LSSFFLFFILLFGTSQGVWSSKPLASTDAWDLGQAFPAHWDQKGRDIHFPGEIHLRWMFWAHDSFFVWHDCM
jgi:hypothetical protein